MTDYKQRGAEIRSLVKKTQLRVLVWGPGKTGQNVSQDEEKAYKKRLQIKQEIVKVFTESEVYFSEDEEMKNLAEGFGGQLRKEAFQAMAANVVIMLDLGRGVDLELDHFLPSFSWFPPKVHLLMPSKYVDTAGLVQEVYDHLKPSQISGFTPEQFDRCDVATSMAVDAVLGYAFDKFAKFSD